MSSISQEFMYYGLTIIILLYFAFKNIYLLAISIIYMVYILNTHRCFHYFFIHCTVYNICI